MFISIIKKKGRPCKTLTSNCHLIEKKVSLFGNTYEVKNQHMNLVNIAYHSNKITEKEKDVAVYLECLYSQVKKELGVKTIPKSAPNTWTNKMKISYTKISQNAEKAIRDWNNIKMYLHKSEPQIAAEFFNLICVHHSYEELLALKLNYQIMDILKKGLSCIQKMFDA